MRNKVTQTDIANKLNVSRNTISKVFNNESGVSEEMKELVLKTAIEMGYQKLQKLPEKNIGNIEVKNIGLLTHDTLLANPFWSYIVKGLTDTLNDSGYNLVIHMMSLEDEKEYLLHKRNFFANDAGLVMIGIFTREFTLRIQSEGLPIVFADTLTDYEALNIQGDIIMPDNETGIYKLTKRLISLGHRHIGFIGDKTLCRSFYERWLGYRSALEDVSIAIDSVACLNERLKVPYYSYAEILEWLESIKDKMPTAFVCANDITAVNVIYALGKIGFQVPGDISVVGFDDIDDATRIIPNLTTVRCFKKEMGQRIGEEILWRIKNPDRPYEVIRIATEIVGRDSDHSIK